MRAIKPHKPNRNKGVVRGRKANNGVNAGGLFAEQLDQFYLIMPECVYLHKHQVCEQIIRFVPRPSSVSAIHHTSPVVPDGSCVWSQLLYA